MENIDDLNLFEDMGIDDTIEIAGFKGKIDDIHTILEKIDSIKNNCCDGCVIQLMNAKAIAGKKHLLHSVIHALLAFKRNTNLANDLGIEIVLRASAQRQISKALDILGLKKGKMDIAIVLINCPDYFLNDLANIFTRDNGVLDPNLDDLKEFYGISDKKLAIFDIEDIMIDKTSALIIDL
ncbi:Regulatory protein Cgi121 [Candidatus Methanobinarius endosymbioticus]|uniref:Regulatory protein Cgi121 n=1 Tax=Candidatus Methanobinarius endosymbioticus TaxID=2006182 RepID=A0A366M8F5_9EURY|nr:Regulatory protein Cgi121 [Candidatus Methanobinarius endosymbioticus]